MSEVEQKFELKSDGGFDYIEEGQGECLLLLHGLFGALSNWDGVISEFRDKYRVIIPVLPIYDAPLKSATIKGLVKYVDKFVHHKSLSTFNIVGNSLGGHIGLAYTLENLKRVKRLVLTGSSGLFENSMGGSFPRRSSYEFVKEKVAYTFYNPKVATKALVDSVFEVTKSAQKCLRMISFARSAQRHNMAKEIPEITTPTLLIWGLNDTITPPFVGHEFNRLLPNSQLKFIDKCGHAPMMEHPKTFSNFFRDFLEKPL